MHARKCFIALLLLLSLPMVAIAYNDDAYYEDDDSYYNHPVTNSRNAQAYDDGSSDAYYLPPDDEFERPTKYVAPTKKASAKKSKTPDPTLPEQITPPGEPTIIVDPKIHAWGAYSEEGRLLRSGLATAGSNWCPDIERPCRTSVGRYRITSMGDSDCVSSIYPVGEGGAPMPYCMFFNGGLALHGSNQVVRGNVSHGCVRLRVRDAEWLHDNFADVGTQVIIRSY